MCARTQTRARRRCHIRPHLKSRVSAANLQLWDVTTSFWRKGERTGNNGKSLQCVPFPQPGVKALTRLQPRKGRKDPDHERGAKSRPRIPRRPILLPGKPSEARPQHASKQTWLVPPVSRSTNTSHAATTISNAPWTRSSSGAASTSHLPSNSTPQGRPR